MTNKAWEEADAKLQNYILDGWHFDSAFNSESDAEKRLALLELWGFQVGKVVYPTGTMLVFKRN